MKMASFTAPGAACLLMIVAASPLPAQPATDPPEGTTDIISGRYTSGSYESQTFVNNVLGWQAFYDAGFTGSSTIIANIEAGHIWGGHNVFQRSAGSAVGRLQTGTGSTGETDYHATMVGHVLAGSGAGPSFERGTGMAPGAELWSGAIATSFSSSSLGSFTMSTSSVISVYKAFFHGIDGVKPDVINSSWGTASPAATGAIPLALEGLARQNPSVVFVASAGNAGAGAPSFPGSGHNHITVGSLGGEDFLEPSSTSSRGALDFYNPGTGLTLTGVRAGVDIAAPGELFTLAAWLGPSGALQATGNPSVQDPSPANQYFTNRNGTSFAAPIVAGGIALLKDAANLDPVHHLNDTPAAQDARVVKSILMAGSRETNGWNNGQHGDGGVVRTTQALDYATGAGALDLDGARFVYLLSDTRDLSGESGGTIGAAGWDFGTVGLSESNDYAFENAFGQEIHLTASLNWFAGRTFNDITNLGADLSFSDLNLQVWEISGGIFSSLMAESATLYNTSEFLRLTLPSGHYGLRVTFDNLIYDLTGDVTGESYGLAWRVDVVVPEPGTVALLTGAGILFVVFRRRRQG